MGNTARLWGRAGGRRRDRRGSWDGRKDGNVGAEGMGAMMGAGMEARIGAGMGEGVSRHWSGNGREDGSRDGRWDGCQGCRDLSPCPPPRILGQRCTFRLVPASPSHRVEGLVRVRVMGRLSCSWTLVALTLPWDLSQFLLLVLTGGCSLSQERGPPRAVPSVPLRLPEVPAARPEGGVSLRTSWLREPPWDAPAQFHPR